MQRNIDRVMEHQVWRLTVKGHDWELDVSRMRDGIWYAVDADGNGFEHSAESLDELRDTLVEEIEYWMDLRLGEDD